MTNKNPIFVVLAILLLAGIFATANVQRVYAAGTSVNLDANSLSQTDVVVSTTATQIHGFRIGAVIAANSTIPISNVYGWQFQLNYNASAFVPQGDPIVANPAYPDGAANTVLYGAQTT